MGGRSRRRIPGEMFTPHPSVSSPQGGTREYLRQKLIINRLGSEAHANVLTNSVFLSN